MDERKYSRLTKRTAERIELIISELPNLPQRDIVSVRELLEGGESEIALEVLCTQIYEWELRVTSA